MSFLCCNLKSIAVINPIKNPVYEEDNSKLEDAYNKLKVINNLQTKNYRLKQAILNKKIKLITYWIYIICLK